MDKNLVFQYLKLMDHKVHLNVCNRVKDNWIFWVLYHIKCEYMRMKMFTKQQDIEWPRVKKIWKRNGKLCFSSICGGICMCHIINSSIQTIDPSICITDILSYSYWICFSILCVHPYLHKCLDFVCFAHAFAINMIVDVKRLSLL